MRYNHFIWDWNGTLLDDRWLTVASMNRLLKRRGMEFLTEERYMDVFSFPVKDYYVALGFDFDKEPFSISGTEFIVEYNKRALEPVLHEGVMSTLDELTQNGSSHSILSASKQDILNELMIHYSLAGYFDHVIGQDDHYAFGKTEAGRELIGKLSIPAEKIIFVGDTIHDYEVARELGVDCALMSLGHTSIKRLKATGAPVFSGFRELQDWLTE